MRSLWSHGLAFVLGGVMTLLIFAAIENVKAQRRHAELEAEVKAVEAEANTARAAAEEAEAKAKAVQAAARLKVLLPK
jgi:hypothetical protein